MAKVFRKLVTGGGRRPTRFHTEQGDLIPAKEFGQIPIVLSQYIATRITGRRPAEPWWPRSVIPVIDKYLSPEANVIEFGSGGSTVWLGRRCRSVLSIEDNLEWYQKSKARIEKECLSNASLRFATGPNYYDLNQLEVGLFDLAVVDGSCRYKCIEAVLPRMKLGGWVYLDNSDADKDKSYYPDPRMDREAQRLMMRYVEQNPRARITRFVSMLSAELHAGEGMLLEIAA